MASSSNRVCRLVAENAPVTTGFSEYQSTVDFFGPAERDGRASDHDFYLRSQAGFLQRFHHALLIAHGCGQQRRYADNVCVELACFGSEHVASDVDAEIVYAETVRRQQRSDQNLANLVDVALGRAQHHDTRHRPLRAEFPQFRSSTAMAARMASAEAIMSGRNIWPLANCSPTSCMPGT